MSQTRSTQTSRIGIRFDTPPVRSSLCLLHPSTRSKRMVSASSTGRQATRTRR